MRERTVSEKRQLALDNLTRDYNIPKDVARNLMNRFYRLCGALVVLEKDAKTV